MINLNSKLEPNNRTEVPIKVNLSILCILLRRQSLEIARVTVTTAQRSEEIKVVISPSYPIVHASDKARPAQQSRSSLNTNQTRQRGERGASAKLSEKVFVREIFLP